MISSPQPRYPSPRAGAGGGSRARYWAWQRACGLDLVTVGAAACCDPLGERLFDEVAAAQALGHGVKAVLTGPLSLLWRGEPGDVAGVDRLGALDQLLPAYCQALARLKAQGVQWVQIDEPILGLELPYAWRNAFEPAYWQLNQAGAPLLLGTDFAPLRDKLGLACRLPVAGLHVDGMRAPHELASIADWLPVHKVLSVGIVDGRHRQRTDLDAALAVLQPIVGKRNGKLWLATSRSQPPASAPPAGATGQFGQLRTLKQALGRGVLLHGEAGHRRAAFLQARTLAGLPIQLFPQ